MAIKRVGGGQVGGGPAEIPPEQTARKAETPEGEAAKSAAKDTFTDASKKQLLDQLLSRSETASGGKCGPADLAFKYEHPTFASGEALKGKFAPIGEAMSKKIVWAGEAMNKKFHWAGEAVNEKFNEAGTKFEKAKVQFSLSQDNIAAADALIAKATPKLDVAPGDALIAKATPKLRQADAEVGKASPNIYRTATGNVRAQKASEPLNEATPKNPDKIK